MVDIFSKEKRSEVMRAIKSKNTGIEKTLFAIARGLWGICRYRKHFRIYGVRPDLWFPRVRLAVFADGDFWHGRDFELKCHKYLPYWKSKIESNISRDQRQNEILRSHGIHVLRIWGSDLVKNPDEIRVLMEELIRSSPRLSGHDGKGQHKA